MTEDSRKIQAELEKLLATIRTNTPVSLVLAYDTPGAENAQVLMHASMAVASHLTMMILTSVQGVIREGGASDKMN